MDSSDERHLSSKCKLKIVLFFYLNLNALLFSKYNYNIIIIDWSKYAAVLTTSYDGTLCIYGYQCAAHNTIAVGQSAAVIAYRLGYFYGEKIHCIGHSLGSHVCGFFGKKFQVQFQTYGQILSRITGSAYC